MVANDRAIVFGFCSAAQRSEPKRKIPKSMADRARIVSEHLVRKPEALIWAVAWIIGLPLSRGVLCVSLDDEEPATTVTVGVAPAMQSHGALRAMASGHKATEAAKCHVFDWHSE